jgi:hypothetical protein
VTVLEPIVNAPSENIMLTAKHFVLIVILVVKGVMQMNVSNVSETETLSLKHHPSADALPSEVYQF